MRDGQRLPFGKLPLEDRNHAPVASQDVTETHRGENGFRVLRLKLERGDLGRGQTLLGWPAGRAFVAKLMVDLKRWGYLKRP